LSPDYHFNRLLVLGLIFFDKPLA